MFHRGVLIGEQEIFNFAHCNFHDVSSGFHDDFHHDHDNDRMDHIFPAELSDRMGNWVHCRVADQLTNTSTSEKTGRPAYDRIVEQFHVSRLTIVSIFERHPSGMFG